MSLDAFNYTSTCVLTSTTSSQVTVVPNGWRSLVVYNAANNPVYLAFAATVAVPTTGVWTDKVMVVQPGTTQVFAGRHAGGNLAYIASTAGGTLVLSVGEGV